MPLTGRGWKTTESDHCWSMLWAQWGRRSTAGLLRLTEAGPQTTMSLSIVSQPIHCRQPVRRARQKYNDMIIDTLTGNIKVGLLKDWATATENMRRKFGEVQTPRAGVTMSSYYVPPLTRGHKVMLRFVRPSVCLSVPFYDSVSFARWRYARVVASNALAAW